jgi:peptide/nickel transport system substrate-binding protein
MGLSVCLCACGANQAPCAQSPPPTLRMAVDSPVPPHTPGHPVVTPMMFTDTQLLRLDMHGRPIPALAREWQTTDRQTWTLTLRDGLFSHDGQPVTAERVRATLLAGIVDFDPVWRDMRQIDTPTPTTIVFHLAHANSMLPEALSNLGVAVHGLKTGPFRATRDTPDRIDYVAFPNYWGGAPRLAGVRVDFYHSPRAAWAALLRNEADFLYEVPPAAVPLLARNPDIRMYPGRSQYIFTLGFQIHSPRLRDVRVRQALNLAIDRDALVRRVFADYEQLAGNAKPAAGPFSQDYWAAEDAGPMWPYDPAAARALLSAATHGGTKPLELVCLTSGDFPLFADLAAVLAVQLERVHVRLRLEPLPLQAFDARMGSGDFDLFAIPMRAGLSGLWPYIFWHSGSPQQLLKSGYASADADLDALATAATPEAERAAVRAVVETMHRDPPAAFVLPMPLVRAVRSTWQVPDDTPDIRYSLPRWTLKASTPCSGS